MAKVHELVSSPVHSGASQNVFENILAYVLNMVAEYGWTTKIRRI
jgi:hypothetical protein